MRRVNISQLSIFLNTSRKKTCSHTLQDNLNKSLPKLDWNDNYNAVSWIKISKFEIKIVECWSVVFMDNHILVCVLNIAAFPSNLGQNIIEINGVQYIAKIMQIGGALLWLCARQFHPNPSGLVPWHWGNHMMAPVPMKHYRYRWIYLMKTLRCGTTKNEAKQSACIFYDYPSARVSTLKEQNTAKHNKA